jgi:peptidoglycan/LPS O-acetylase OafA/YrhL
MGLFWLEASALQRFVSFYRRAVAEEVTDRARYPQLDGLRGLLALGVFFSHSILFHYYLTTGTLDHVRDHSRFYTQMGIVCVYFFFFLTGFLFWTKAQAASLPDLRTYFWHRVRRLYPAFALPVLAYALILVVYPGETPGHSARFLSHLLLYCLTFFLTPYLWLGKAEWIFSMMWTLRVEWMFYILLPVLAPFARTRWKQLLLLGVAISLLFLLPQLHTLPSLNHSAGKSVLDGIDQLLYYFDGFLVRIFFVGMAVAFLRRKYPLARIAPRDPYTAALFLVCVGIALESDARVLSTFNAGILFSPFLVVVFGSDLMGLLRSRPLLLLGQISYSIYLLHLPILYFLYKALPIMATPAASPLLFWLFTALAGSIVVALSALSYRFIEVPCMQGYGSNKKIAPPQGAAPGIGPIGSTSAEVSL